jgi:hypothetical protein
LFLQEDFVAKTVTDTELNKEKFWKGEQRRNYPTIAKEEAKGWGELQLVSIKHGGEKHKNRLVSCFDFNDEPWADKIRDEGEFTKLDWSNL